MMTEKDGKRQNVSEQKVFEQSFVDYWKEKMNELSKRFSFYVIATLLLVWKLIINISGHVYYASFNGKRGRESE